MCVCVCVCLCPGALACMLVVLSHPVIHIVDRFLCYKQLTKNDFNVGVCLLFVQIESITDQMNNINSNQDTGMSSQVHLRVTVVLLKAKTTDPLLAVVDGIVERYAA